MSKKKVLLIVNPTSGKNKSRPNAVDIVNKFSPDDYEFDIRATTCQGDATNIIKKHIGDNDMVICCGGDGTFNETVNGVMQLTKRIPIGYLPAGSTNDLANTIGLPLDIDKSTAMIADGHINAYDIGLFNNRYFTYIASFGAATNFSYETPKKIKNAFGHNGYLLYALGMHPIATLKTVKPTHVKIEYDGNVIEDDFYFGSISNSTSVAGIFKFSESDVKLDDGRFELLLVRKLSSPLESFALLGQIKRKHYDGKKVLFLKCSSVKMTFEEETPWTLDGEYGGTPKEVRFSVLNGAVDIFSPENAMFTGKPYEAVLQEMPEEEKKENSEKTSRIRKFRKGNKAEEADEITEDEAQAEETADETIAAQAESPASAEAENEDK